jgi:hypothetical protein
MEETLKNKIYEFYRRNHVLGIHAPMILIGMFVSYLFLSWLDPRIGVEGFGDIFGYGLLALRASIIIFTTFFFKRWAFFDIYRTTELELFEASRRGDYFAERILTRDRLEWVALLCVFSYLFTH